VTTPRRAVLFDLDGTLLDTAPDMLAALRQLADENRREHRIDYHDHKALVTHGAKSLIQSVFGPLDESRLRPLRQRYLAIYQQRLAEKTRLFEGVGDMLEGLRQARIPWGIVTNKPGWLCEPLVRAVAELEPAAVLVAGDTLAVAKPDPRPLQHAMNRLGIAPQDGIYVGDAKTDTLAAHRAGMPAAVALWGYLQPDDQPRHWQAELLHHPQEILQWF